MKMEGAVLTHRKSNFLVEVGSGLEGIVKQRAVMSKVCGWLR